MRRIKSSRAKLTFVFFICLLLFCSCKRENVCSLTPQQSPEIRGFRLGMPYEEIEKRFDEVNLPYSEKDSKFKVFLSLYDSNPQKWAESEGSAPYNLSRQKYPEFDGVSSVHLIFSNKILTSLNVTYNNSKDSDFNSVFVKRTIETLNLSQWTNWDSKKDSPIDFDSSYHRSVYTDDLLCQNFYVKIAVAELIPTNISNLERNGITYYPSITIEMTDEKALTESQKKELTTQQESQRRDEQLKKINEEKRKTEAFKP